MKLHTREITLHAVLVSAALVLSFIESQLPPFFIPIPGIKLGLANVVSLYALFSLSPRSALIVLLCRCPLAALFGGGVTSLAFSLCGGLLSLLAMIISKRLGIFSIYGVSIIGAAFHGIGQVLIACILLSSLSALFYLPLLLFSSLITGTLTGLISFFLILRLKFLYKN